MSIFNETLDFKRKVFNIEITNFEHLFKKFASVVCDEFLHRTQREYQLINIEGPNNQFGLGNNFFDVQIYMIKAGMLYRPNPENKNKYLLIRLVYESFIPNVSKLTLIVFSDPVLSAPIPPQIQEQLQNNFNVLKDIVQEGVNVVNKRGAFSLGQKLSAIKIFNEKNVPAGVPYDKLRQFIGAEPEKPPTHQYKYLEELKRSFQ